jgi:hypothetical protein
VSNKMTIMTNTLIRHPAGDIPAGSKLTVLSVEPNGYVCEHPDNEAAEVKVWTHYAKVTRFGAFKELEA